ncbi:MAG: MOSC domain-containing protein, partial [Myxococcota bacterium]
VEVPNTEPTRAEIWGQWTTGRDAGDAAAEWFSSYLGRPCRLLYQSDADIRPVKPRPNTVESDHVSFADGYPVLLIGTASLAELNRWIGRTPPILMDRFRPNIVVETSRPFEEDDWQSFRLGDAAFVNAKPCPRCVLTTFDPQSAQRDPDGEPLKALAKRRRDPNGDVVWFGTNVMPRSAGPIRVGDEFSTS